MKSVLLLSAPYKTYLNNLLTAYPDLAFTLYSEGQYFGCGLACLDTDGTGHRVECLAATPDQAFLLAYATLGMNLNIW